MRQMNELIEEARQFAYSQFNEIERQIIEKANIEWAKPIEVALINEWFNIYTKKLKELKEANK